MRRTGGAVPPHTMRTGDENFQRPGFLSSAESTPSQTVGTPPARVTCSRSIKIEDVFGVHVGTRKNEFRANHNAGVREAPGIGMKHGCDREHRVVVADRKGIGHGTSERMQNQRAVGVDHSFGESRGAGGEAHGGAIVFVEFWILEVIGGAGQEVLVTEKSGRDLASAVSCDDHTLESNVLAKLLVNGKQHVIDDQKTRARVPDDSRYFVGVKSKIHGVQNAAGRGNTKEGFQVAGMIPHHGADAIAGLQAQLRQSRGETPGAPVEFAIVGAGDGAIRPPRNDFDAGKEPARAIEQRGKRQRKVHHGAAHECLTDRMGKPQ